MSRLLTCFAAILILLCSADAEARRWMVTQSGGLLPAPAAAKSQAFCQANPTALLVFNDSLSLSPSSVVQESIGNVSLQANISVEAVCVAGPVTLRLRYGALVGSTANECCDYLPFQLQVVSPSLPTFGPTVAFSGSTSITIVDDDLEEETEELRIGLLGGEVLGPNLIDIAGSSLPLATLVIEDDDGLDLSLGGVTGTVNTGLGGNQDPVARAAVDPLAENCSTATDQAIRDQCAAIVALAESSNPSALVQVLGAISGEELSAQVTSSIDGANQRGSQIDGRIAALRGGATGISLDDVAFNYRGDRLPASMMFNALAGDGPAAADEGFGGGLLDKRLGAFLNVTVLGGKRDASNFEVGFDFDGYSALAGLDWRFSDRFIAGAAVGWSDLSNDLDNDGGGLDSQGLSLTGYGTWLFSDSAYLDFSVSKLWNDYDQRRVVDLGPLGQGFGRSVAAGSTEADQTSVSLGGGWDVAFGEWIYSPRASLTWSDSGIDGFTESGAGINDLIFGNQELESLLWTFSQSVSRSFSISSGALQPYATLDLSRETRNDAFSITPTLRVRPEQRSTPIFIEESDRFFGRADVGVSFVGSGGFQWFASYSRLLGYDKVQAWAFRGGLRLEF